MSDCRYRGDRVRLEFDNRPEGGVPGVVEVMGCEKHGECTLADFQIANFDLAAGVDPDGCGHRGNKLREMEGTCCSGGPLIAYECAIYGECSPKGAPDVPKACVRCHRHTDRQRLVMVCDRCVDRQQ